MSNYKATGHFEDSTKLELWLKAENPQDMREKTLKHIKVNYRNKLGFQFSSVRKVK